MKVVIVEDERAASENLQYILRKLEPRTEVLEVLDSVKSAVTFFAQPNEAELVFLDIHLADGISFEIFEKVNISIPVIFITAYDQYALKAFKVHSIDYLLKPIDEQDLAKALNQFRTQLHGNANMNLQMERLLNMVQTRKSAYKNTLLVTRADELIPLKADTIAYLRIDDGIVKLHTLDNQVFFPDKNLEEMEAELDPSIFCRLNRQYIAHRDAIANIRQYFNGKLVVNLKPPVKERVVVSKARAKEFREWLDS
jgi:two-component system, LytTR family, response regulator LytT